MGENAVAHIELGLARTIGANVLYVKKQASSKGMPVTDVKARDGLPTKELKTLDSL